MSEESLFVIAERTGYFPKRKLSLVGAFHREITAFRALKALEDLAVHEVERLFWEHNEQKAVKDALSAHLAVTHWENTLQSAIWDKTDREPLRAGLLKAQEDYEAKHLVMAAELKLDTAEAALTHKQYLITETPLENLEAIEALIYVKPKT